MKPKLSVVLFFLIIPFVLLFFCVYYDKIISAFDFENTTTVQSTAKNSYKDSCLLIGTQQEILFLKVSKERIIKEWGLFVRGGVNDPSKPLPKEFFISVEEK